MYYLVLILHFKAVNSTESYSPYRLYDWSRDSRQRPGSCQWCCRFPVCWAYGRRNGRGLYSMFKMKFKRVSKHHGLRQQTVPYSETDLCDLRKMPKSESQTHICQPPPELRSTLLIRYYLIGFLIAGFTNAINHVIHHHLHLTSDLALPPLSMWEEHHRSQPLRRSITIHILIPR